MADIAKQETTTGVTDTPVEVVPLLREQVVRKTVGGIGRTTLWRWVREGRFPKPIRLGANCIAWRADDINQWINSRPSFDDERV